TRAVAQALRADPGAQQERLSAARRRRAEHHALRPGEQLEQGRPLNEADSAAGGQDLNGYTPSRHGAHVRSETYSGGGGIRTLGPGVTGSTVFKISPEQPGFGF